MLKTNNYHIYALIDCSYAKKAIELLSSKNLPFIVTIMDKDPDFLNSFKEAVQWQTVPIIMHGSSLVGGFSELEQKIQELEVIQND